MADETFYVVLHDLETVAHKYLPTMSDIYGVAHRAAQQSHATPLPPSFPEKPSTTVDEAYSDLQRAAVRMLHEIQANLADAADALKATARDYEDSDRLNAKAFERLMKREPVFPEKPGEPDQPK